MLLPNTTPLLNITLVLTQSCISGGMLGSKIPERNREQVATDWYARSVHRVGTILPITNKQAGK
ncbi:hypothetical protein KSF_063880 [Reticulibacter mediterranei]|uniref:Uncharacterized protein n=1 Tax=Reticulibacter mediterranei TaxID=2778369 RepID=A0A8J3N5F8_9CHLR|nr:hypothetical protein KSF_063880 [Reticulibacter mediterranei]